MSLNSLIIQLPLKEKKWINASGKRNEFVWLSMFWVSLLDPPANREGENTLSCFPPNGKTIVLCCHCLNMSPLGDKVRNDVLRNTFCKYRLQFSPALKTRPSPLSADTYKVGTSVLQLHGTEFLLQLHGTEFLLLNSWEQILPQSLQEGSQISWHFDSSFVGLEAKETLKTLRAQTLANRLITNLDCFKILNVR